MSNQTLPELGLRSKSVLFAVCALLLAVMALHIHAAYWQCDDAYISFRYVRNCVDGFGLVFNPNERVEGYTNFAFVLELAALWKWFGLRPERAADVLSILSTIGSLVVVGAMIRRIRSEPARWFVFVGTLLLLATSHTWAVWSTSGLETRQFTFFVLLGLFLVSRAGLEPKRLLVASLAFVGAELTRPDGALIWASAGAWVIVEMIIARRFAWRGALAYGIPFVLLVGAHFVWRHSYYGDWFPNTYYAKYLQAWPEAGFRYFAAAAIEGGAWFMLPFALVAAIHRTRQGDRTHWLSLIVVLAHILYLVRIGGDHFELRPLDFYWPLLILAAAEGGWITAHWVETRVRRRVGWLVAAVVLALLTLYGAVVQQAKLAFTMQFDTRANSHFMKLRLERPEDEWIRRIPPLAPMIDAYNDLQAYLLPHGVGISWREHERFWRAEMVNWQPYEAPSLAGYLPKSAISARGSTGAYGFYIPSVELVDMLGLTDRHIAQQPSKRTNDQRYMAHDRSTDMAYLDRRGFNILFAPAATSPAEAFLRAPYAIRVSDSLWLPFTSKNSDWVHESSGDFEIWSLGLAEQIGCFRPDVMHKWSLVGEPLESAGVSVMPFSPVVPWPLRCDNGFGLSTRAADQSGKGSCRATSPRFRVPDACLFEARLRGIGAGCQLRILDKDDAVICVLTTPDPDWLLPLHFDLSPFAGQELRVEVSDAADDSWVEFGGVVLLTPARLRPR